MGDAGGSSSSSYQYFEVKACEQGLEYNFEDCHTTCQRNINIRGVTDEYGALEKITDVKVG